MSGRTKIFTVSALVLLLIVCSLLATRINVLAIIHRETGTPIQTPTQTESTTASFNVSTSIQSISISDASPASIWWIPYYQESVLSQVIAWLKQATPYTEKIPQSQNMGIINAYVGPVRLTLTTSDKHLIEVYPAYYMEKSGNTHTAISTDEYGVVTKTENPEFQVQYVQDVLVFDNGGDRTYLKSEPLYNGSKRANGRQSLN